MAYKATISDALKISQFAPDGISYDDAYLLAGNRKPESCEFERSCLALWIEKFATPSTDVDAKP